MEPKYQEAQQGQIKSTLEETLQAIDNRMKFFQTHHLSIEPELLKISGETIKSIGDIASGLGTYFFSQSPVQPSLRDLYTSQYQTAQQYRCVLPPPSEGEDSVTEQQITEPTFQWLSQAIIDSTLLTVDKVDARRPQKGNVPSQWGNSTQLLIYNISKKIHLKPEVKNLEKILTTKFYLTRVKKMKQIYYKGKPSLLIRFVNEYNCSYAYYNLCHYETNRKQIAGEHSQVFKITSNRLKNIQQQKWIAVLFRRLPPILLKEQLLDLLRKRNISPVWIQELIQIDNFKYTLCRVSFLDDAFELCSKFQINSPIKEVKVNLHPKSCKTWKGSNQDF